MLSDELNEVIKHQAELESLWTGAKTIREALLQSALRHLHAVIEGDALLANIAKKVYWNVDSEL